MIPELADDDEVHDFPQAQETDDLAIADEMKNLVFEETERTPIEAVIDFLREYAPVGESINPETQEGIMATVQPYLNNVRQDFRSPARPFTKKPRR
jgi:hypothetical protein